MNRFSWPFNLIYVITSLHGKNYLHLTLNFNFIELLLLIYNIVTIFLFNTFYLYKNWD